MLEPLNLDTLRQRWEASWKHGGLETLNTFLAPGYTPHHPLNPVTGPDGMRHFIDCFQQAFPDLVFKIDDIIESLDKVVVRWSMSGTHLGELMGVPASGRRATLTGISIYRFEEGMTVESWDEINIWSLLYQLGVMAG